MVCMSRRHPDDDPGREPEPEPAAGGKPTPSFDELLARTTAEMNRMVAAMHLNPDEEQWVREEAAGLHSHIIKAAIDSYPFIKRADCAMFAVTLAFLSVKAWAEHEDRNRPPRA
jgi:hypothetical protein